MHCQGKLLPRRGRESLRVEKNCGNLLDRAFAGWASETESATRENRESRLRRCSEYPQLDAVCYGGYARMFPPQDFANTAHPSPNMGLLPYRMAHDDGGPAMRFPVDARQGVETPHFQMIGE
jgi:hypothetical protein